MPKLKVDGIEVEVPQGATVMQACNAAGKEIHVWTVNRPADMDLMRELGVDAVITDHPDEMLRRLGRDAAVS